MLAPTGDHLFPSRRHLLINLLQIRFSQGAAWCFKALELKRGET